MKTLKFKRYKINDPFNLQTAERDTVHIVPTSLNPLTVIMYDVDAYGNVAEVSTNNDYRLVGIADFNTIPEGSGKVKYQVFNPGVYLNFKDQSDNPILITQQELDQFNVFIISNNGILSRVEYAVNTNSEILYNNLENENEKPIRALDIIKRVDKNTGSDVNYREVTKWHDGSTMSDIKTDGVIYKKIGSKYYERQFDGALNVKWFGTKGEGLINNDIMDMSEYESILACFLMALKLKKDVYIPSGTYNVGARWFPFKTQFPNVVSLFDCHNITIFGDGDSTILMSQSINGADVLNLHMVKNIHFKDFAITGIVTGNTIAGTNGISIVSGYENITIDNVLIYNLYGIPLGGFDYSSLLVENKGEFNPVTNTPNLLHTDSFVDGNYFTVNEHGTKSFGSFIYTLSKGDIIFKKDGVYDVVKYYVDGGKALTLQNDDSPLECGTLKANIRVKGCGYGFGMDYQITNLANKKTAINVEMIAEDCHRGISFNGDGTDVSVLNEFDGTNINIKANLINCQTDLHLTTIKGVNMDLSIQTTKTAEQRRKLPDGSRYWNEYEKTVKVCDLLYVKDSFITIYGNKGQADYKYKIGGFNANVSLDDDVSTSRNILNLNVSADAEKLLLINNIGGGFMSNNIIYFI